MASDPRPIKTATRTVRRDGAAATRHVEVDICVLGAASPASSAALEAARLGRKVALVDGLPALGGQAVNSVIGTFCGFFANGHARLPDHPRHRRRHPARPRRAGRAALPPRRAVQHHGRDVRRGRAVALDRGGGPQGRDHGPARCGDARGARATAARIRELDFATRYGDVQLTAAGLRRCDRRRRAGLGGGLRLPRAGRRADLRHPDGGARRRSTRRNQPTRARRSRHG